MRAFGLMKYHLRRNWRLISIYFAAVLIITLVATFSMMRYTSSVSMITDENGVQVVEANTGMALYDDPGTFASLSTFSMLIWISALCLTGRERRFMVTMSVSRWEILTGTFYYLAVLSLIMTLQYYLVQVIGRGVLWISGFRIRSGWDINMLFTGGNQNLPADLMLGFASMVSLAGIYTLIGYLFTRWWRQILILFAIGVAVVIIMVTQIRIGQYLAEMREWFEQLVVWFFDVALPAIENYYSETRTGILALRYLVTGVVCTMISYPIMRGMKVVK